MKNYKKWTALLLALVMLCALAGCGSAEATQPEAEADPLAQTAQWLLKEVPEPRLGPVGGEWTVLGLVRSEQALPEGYLEGYYDRLCDAVAEKDGILNEKKYTEYSRVILALTAIGKVPGDVAGFDLLQPLADQKQTVFQGVNGAAYALLALDSGKYEIPALEAEGEQASREGYIGWILEKEADGGGWGFNGKTADPDITAMVLQAFAKYRDRDDVAAAVDRAIAWLSQQYGSGALASLSCESWAQLIVALAELGISVEEDRFIAEGKTLKDQLFAYRTADGGFRHTLQEEKANLMATEQAFYALVAMDRMEQGKSSLYSMK